jgi:hypothetical protein
MKAYGGVEVWPHHSWLRHLMKMSGKLHAPAALSLGEEPPITISSDTGWTSEPVWTLWSGEISCLCRESNLGRPAGSSTLYLQSYSGSNKQLNQKLCKQRIRRPIVSVVYWVSNTPTELNSAAVKRARWSESRGTQQASRYSSWSDP